MKIKTIILMSIILTLLTGIAITAQASTYDWDFETYSKQFSSDTEINQKTYTDFPQLEFGKNGSQ